MTICGGTFTATKKYFFLHICTTNFKILFCPYLRVLLSGKWLWPQLPMVAVSGRRMMYLIPWSSTGFSSSSSSSATIFSIYTRERVCKHEMWKQWVCVAGVIKLHFMLIKARSDDAAFFEPSHVQMPSLQRIFLKNKPGRAPVGANNMKWQFCWCFSRPPLSFGLKSNTCIVDSSSQLLAGKTVALLEIPACAPPNLSCHSASCHSSIWHIVTL